MDYRFLLDLAIILFVTKVLGLVMKKFGLPQVVGALIAGILIGPAIWFPMTGGKFTLVRSTDFLNVIAELGVIMIMFSAGLETDLHELKNCGLKAGFVALLGVGVPLALGFGIAVPFFGVSDTHNVLKCVFIGVILTATSVSITVETLRELGKLKGKTGTVILSAAIIDDVIGIVLLSVVTGVAKSGAVETDNPFIAFKSTIYGTVIMIVCFFIFAVAAGFLLSKCFKWLDKRWPTTHRIPIFSLAVCFAYSWLAEEIFGVADITGAFLAGVVLSTDHRASVYTDTKVEVNTYTVFAPVFFANIGISSISFAGLDPKILLFAFLAVLMGLIGKIIGCGAIFKAFKYSWRESAIGGVGMFARGEVALIVTAAVTNSEVLGAYALGGEFMIMTVLLILISSVLTPVLLKVLYSKEKIPPSDGGGETLNENAEAGGESGKADGIVN